MHIFVYNSLNAGLQFFTAVRVVAHAEAGLALAEQTAARRGAASLPGDGSARRVDDINIEKPAQRMLLFNATGRALGLE